MSLVNPASPLGPNGLATSTFPSIDPNLVVEYLASVLEITLGASRQDLEKDGSLLSKTKHSDTVQRCTRFATESQTALYVQKDVAAAESVDGVPESSSMLSFCSQNSGLTRSQVQYHTISS